MNLKSSLYLGKAFNIDIKVHWSFFLLVFWFFFSALYQGHVLAEAIYRVLFIFAIFGCVTLHELGHALVAQKFKCQTEQIVLMPIGGMAQMKQLPQKPMEEFLVAIAGPLVNVAIAVIIYFILGSSEFLRLSREAQNIDRLIDGSFLVNLLVINVILAVFNIIPAFPMDGGRMLRALLAIKLNRTKATKIASNIGQFIAVIFVILGFNSSNIILIMVGVFIFLAARAELKYESKRSG